MSQPRILLAEDNLVMADVIRFNLMRSGFDVTVANDGTTAIKKMEQESFDVILLDNQMPGMTGEEICRHHVRHNRHSGTPIMMCSAKGLEMEPQLIEELGLCDIVFKPFSPKALVSQIRSHITVPVDG